ncbi:RHTO0S06e08284g1_1 [Rhodotorula toruloides]|uniref:RHTO0S06e08284g1_1 n=1 Tax=Rhodotorula toruloides TaxID=5286 RepID=A0A061AWN8_RHOTO|nr:RHTO0S06e08284g1_1 [Rhodotorula toruloides]
MQISLIIKIAGTVLLVVVTSVFSPSLSGLSTSNLASSASGVLATVAAVAGLISVGMSYAPSIMAKKWYKWENLGIAAACAVFWAWQMIGAGFASTCTVNAWSSLFCNGAGKIAFYVILVAAALIQLAILVVGRNGGGSSPPPDNSYSLSRSASSGHRRARADSNEWSDFSNRSDSEESDAEKGMLRRGDGVGMSKSEDSESQLARCRGEEVTCVSFPPPPHSHPQQTMSDEGSHSSNIPHLPEGGQKPRVVPTGNIDPSAFSGESESSGHTRTSSSSTTASEPVDIPHAQELQPSHREGDSPHHTFMHVPHGSKEQEEEEERLKCVSLAAL